MRYFTLARKRLGLPQNGVKNKVVVRGVANHYGVPVPSGKEAKWLLIQRFCQENGLKLKTKVKTQNKTEWPNTPEFLESYEWRRLRMVVLTKRGTRCECCGATPKDGLRMHVDHVKPRRLHPELALEESNLQILCEVCNHGKGNWDQTDWRPETTPVPSGPQLVKRVTTMG